MGITLLLTALPSENFQQVRSDPSLVRWLYERAMLDDGVTLQSYYLQPEELTPHELQSIKYVDGLALERRDFFLIDYIEVTDELERETRAPQPVQVSDDAWVANPLLQYAEAFRSLGAGPMPLRVPSKALAALGGPVVLDLPEGVHSLPASGHRASEPFKGEGELGFSMHYGNATYWSPSALSRSVAEDQAWQVAKRVDPELNDFIQGVLQRERYLLALAY
jgi:hypothetical protein